MKDRMKSGRMAAAAAAGLAMALLLTTVAVLVGAIAVGRTIGLVAGGFDANMAVLIGIEIVMVAVLVLAARPGAPASAAG